MATITNERGQVFDVLMPQDRPQDEYGDGRSLRFTVHEHDEMMMPGAIQISDPEGRWAIYVPLEMDGRLVRPQAPGATKLAPDDPAPAADLTAAPAEDDPALDAP